MNNEFDYTIFVDVNEILKGKVSHQSRQSVIKCINQHDQCGKRI